MKYFLDETQILRFGKSWSRLELFKNEHSIETIKISAGDVFLVLGPAGDSGHRYSALNLSTLQAFVIPCDWLTDDFYHNDIEALSF